jgi:hypothetical protein
VPVEIEVEIEQIDDQELIGCVSKDVSLGGARVRSVLGQTISGPVVVVLSPHEEIFVAVGRVVESTLILDGGEAEMRVQFDRVTPPTRQRLSEFLAANSG